MEVAEKSSIRVEPDLDFILTLSKRSGGSFRKCLQCGNCSATCTISPDHDPFPRKEMAWANWGMRDTLLGDPDIWLCYQCGDCSVACPSGARPGDMLAAIRQEAVLHHAVPRFVSNLVNSPRYLPLLIGIPAALLGLALLARDPIEKALGLGAGAGERVVYSYSSFFPQWLLNSFFLLFSVLFVLGVVTAVVRYWRLLETVAVQKGIEVPRTGLFKNFLSVTKTIFAHERFEECETAKTRFHAHLYVFYGFLALFIVTLWTITAPHNPLIRDSFVYPFSFLSPWKLLANLGGAAVVYGCLTMIRDRLNEVDPVQKSTYLDWMFVTLVLVVVISGFVTEGLHYLRLEPHRHVAYFVHLVLVFVLMVSLPYSKFAHVVYRTTAMVFAEHTGRATMSPRSSGGKR
jgi:quinone-modifying oxidoreductase subunit QmoC